MYPIELVVVCDKRGEADDLFDMSLSYAMELQHGGKLRDFSTFRDPNMPMIRLGYSDYRICFMDIHYTERTEKGFKYYIKEKITVDAYLKSYEEIFQKVINEDLAIIGMKPDDPKVKLEVGYYTGGDGIKELVNFLKELELDFGPSAIHGDGGRWFLKGKIRLTVINPKNLDNLYTSPFAGVLITAKTIQEHRDEIKRFLCYYL